MLLKDLLACVEAVEIKGDLHTEIGGIAYDSRKVQKGDLFVCIAGFKVDGHDFIAQAVEKGAAAVVVEKDVEEASIPMVKVINARSALAFIAAAFFDHPSSKFKLIGVTGTNGKTTTTYLIKTILALQGYKVGLIGTNQNMIGDEVIPAERTTPESLELQQLFSRMVREQVDYVVMEVSSHSLALHRVDGCAFEVGIFTNLTQDHLDFHITMENYLKAKTKLFTRCNTGIVNVDDSSSPYILEHGTCKMVTIGIEYDADIRAKETIVSEKGVQFQIDTAQGSANMALGIPGKFSIYNALGSIGACMALGMDLRQIKEGLRSARGVPGRAQVVETGRPFTVLIDYAHTPDGLKNIIGTVKGFAKGRVVTLFGCGGDRDCKKRPVMGKVAGEGSDFCIVTSDNPRTEEPMRIINHILEGMKETDCPHVVIENRLAAIEYALQNAQKDDVIVLAGKGHETYQEINGKKYPFHEEEIVTGLLEKMQ